MGAGATTGRNNGNSSSGISPPKSKKYKPPSAYDHPVLTPKQLAEGIEKTRQDNEKERKEARKRNLPGQLQTPAAHRMVANQGLLRLSPVHAATSKLMARQGIGRTWQLQRPIGRGGSRKTKHHKTKRRKTKRPKTKRRRNGKKRKSKKHRRR